MAAVLDMANDETKPASGRRTFRPRSASTREMTKIAEHEMHAVVLVLHTRSSATARDVASLEAYAALR